MQDVRDVVARLRSSLDAVAAALATADTEALLSAEPHLASALAAVTRVRTVSPEAREDLQQEILKTQLVLDRCRQMGAAALEVSRATLAAEGWSNDYGRGGQTTEPTLRGVSVRERR